MAELRQRVGNKDDVVSVGGESVTVPPMHLWWFHSCLFFLTGPLVFGLHCQREQLLGYLQSSGQSRRRTMDAVVIVLMLIALLVVVQVEFNINGLDVASQWLLRALDPGPIQQSGPASR